MGIAPKGPGTEPQPNGKITNLFNDLLEHQAFKSAPVLRSILLFLWQHQGEPVSEYAIAVDALGRPPDFDPKTDASVRVLIGRLRARLREFNTTESYPLKLRIPVGTHEIQWSIEGPSSDLPGSPSLPSTPIDAAGVSFRRPSPRNLVRERVLRGVALLLIAALAVFCATLFRQNRELVAQQNQKAGSSQTASAPIPRFWKSFLAGGGSPVMVLPSPVSFIWRKRNLILRDLTVADAASWSKSTAMRELAKGWGVPTLTEGYIALADMHAGVRLLTYFNALGLHAELIDSSHFQSDAPGAKSTIYLGFPNRTGYLDTQLQSADFYVSGSVTSPVIVYDRNPPAGQPSEYPEIEYSEFHKIYPGLIILLPPKSGGGQSLILISMVPRGLASMLVTQPGLARLDEKWKNAGSPQAWEMVVDEEVNQDAVLRVWPVAIRALKTAVR